MYQNVPKMESKSKILKLSRKNNVKIFLPMLYCTSPVVIYLYHESILNF